MKRNSLAVSVACVVLVVAATIAYRYFHRPLFADSFGTAEMDILPSWKLSYRFTGDKLILADTRINQAVFILTGDKSYRGNVVPHMRDGIAELRMSNGRVIRIPESPQTLFLFLPDGTQKQCPIAPGVAKHIRDHLLDVNADLAREFETYAARAR